MGRADELRKAVGKLGENLAAEYLKRKGFVILEMNYRKPWGEIDIIAEKGGVVRFVEVKSVTREILPDVSRENTEYRPEEQIHPMKLRKIARTAEMYMNEKGNSREYQIDAVGVFISTKERKARCRLFEQIL